MFWFKGQIERFHLQPRADAAVTSNIHTPLVMVLALVPGFGGVAYLASKPLRSKLLVRLVLDQMAWKLPLHLYRRLHLARLLAPAIKPAAPQAGPLAPARTLAR